VRVGVDGRTLVKGRRGVARYTLGLLTALANEFPDDEYVVLLPPGPQRDAAAEQLAKLPSVTVVEGRGPRRARFAAAALTGRPRLDSELGGNLDVVWLPEPAPVAVSKDVPVVLTVHDLSWEQRPQDFTAYERMWLRAARPAKLARRADRVVAVSDATRRQALERWGLDEDRTRVVHSGVERPASTRASEGGRYLLFVGALEPRKGIDVLARAYAEARANGLVAPLVVAGDGRLRGLLGGDGVRHVGHAGEEELERLYAGAVALVLPSRLEGFGFTPLEALARGKPPILTDLDVFHETVGDAAVYVAVDDAGALSAAMQWLAKDAAARAEIVELGRRALERFTWEKAARETRALFEEATSG
jgi:glycosyltransferase involved in cell wall biosynthesis